MPNSFVVQHDNGQSYLGRYSLSGSLSFVPLAFASVFPSFVDAESVRVGIGEGGRVITLDSVKPAHKPL